MTSDELYNKYLEEEFSQQDETYYCNPRTNEVFWDSQIVDNLIYYDLYHDFARVNRNGCSDRFIYDIKGNPLYLKFPDFFLSNLWFKRLLCYARQKGRVLLLLI